MGNMPMLPFIKSLEGKRNDARRQELLAVLKKLGVKAFIHSLCFPRVHNIVVDFAPKSLAKRLVFSAHYDVVRGSPGANDNTSGVAVLLALCQQLKSSRLPVRIIFFDREEAWLRTPLIRLGLLGSFYYVCINDLRSISALYNVEFCGLGDCLAVWPIKEKETCRQAFKTVKNTASSLGIPLTSIHIPWLVLSSDHLPFRIKGMANALTLSLVPAKQVGQLESFLKGQKSYRLLLGSRQPLPEPLASIHSPVDTCSRLNENSLQLMLSILLELVRTSFP